MSCDAARGFQADACGISSPRALRNAAATRRNFGNCVRDVAEPRFLALGQMEHLPDDEDLLYQGSSGRPAALARKTRASREGMA